MKKRYKVDVSEDEMPVLQQESNRSNKTATESADEAILATKWMSAQALRQVDEHLDDNPYADLMPADMSPSRLVNRKKAKSIPVPLLHHNNIPLLQSFLTETAQIRSRIQTRLGARDQRRVSRLVKRARNLGLIPYQGQFRSEQHGWVHARDIDQERPWEKELERRGLVIKNKMTNMEKKNNYNYTNTTTTQGGEQATYGNDDDENF
jgi:ribosomal protein S18